MSAQSEYEYVAQARAIAREATLLADTSVTGRHARVTKLRDMVDTLAMWTSDDRS